MNKTRIQLIQEHEEEKEGIYKEGMITGFIIGAVCSIVLTSILFIIRNIK